MILYLLSFKINDVDYIGSIPENGYFKPYHPDVSHDILTVVHQIGDIVPVVKPKVSINASVATIIEKRRIRLPRPSKYDKLIQFHANSTRNKQNNQQMINFIKDGSYDYTSYMKYVQEANRLHVKPMEKRAFISLFHYNPYKDLPIDDPNNEFNIPDYSNYVDSPEFKDLPPLPFLTENY